MSAPTLPPAPGALLDDRGRPRFGKYAGFVPARGWSGVAPPPGWLARRVQEKRWVFVTLALPELMVGAAVVDLGYGSQAFAYALDLEAEAMVVEASVMGMPWHRVRVGPGHAAEFSGGGVRVHATPVGTWDPVASRRLDLGISISVPGAGLEVEAVLKLSQVDALTVIAPVEGRPGNWTEKHAGVPCEGSARLKGRSYDLSGAVGGTDRTHGFPPRHTVWGWAMANGRAGDADGPRVGFNLVTEFNVSPGIDEGALWVDGQLTSLPPGRIEVDAGAAKVVAGDLALAFLPLASHRERRNLGLVRSNFRQHAGVFSGGVPGPDGARLQLACLPGVVEQQDVWW